MSKQKINVNKNKTLHYIANGWFVLGEYEESNLSGSWLQADNVQNGTVLQKYLRATYWAASTMITVSHVKCFFKTTNKNMHNKENGIYFILCFCFV